MQYYLASFVDYGFEEAKTRATAALAAEGFGILTEIDATATLQRKLGAEFRPYHILGACNPALAHQALCIEAQVGVLMPCNVVVQQHEDGRVEVSVMNPAILVPVTGNAAIEAVQSEVVARIARVMASL